MVSSIFNLCFQFAAIWLNGFYTEEEYKQTYNVNLKGLPTYIGVILHAISRLPTQNHFLFLSTAD